MLIWVKITLHLISNCRSDLGTENFDLLGFSSICFIRIAKSTAARSEV